MYGNVASSKTTLPDLENLLSHEVSGLFHKKMRGANKQDLDYNKN